MKSFKDFWTHNMRQFYDESWGQENFDHTKIQTAMPGEHEKWKIISADQICNTNRKTGTYDSYKTRNIKCEICGFELRFTINCPNGICSTCQSFTGYHTTNCSKCNYIIKSLKCNICNRTGHELNTCPDLWRRYHQTTTYSNELSKSNISQKSKNKLWCCNCAKQGHAADKCTYPKSNCILPSTKIYSYEATYNSATDEFQLELSFLNYMQTKKENNCESNTTCDNNFSTVQSSSRASSSTKHRRKNNIFDQPTNSVLQKYNDILLSLKNKCKKSNMHSLAKINRYLNDIKDKNISKNKIRNIMKLKKKLMNK